MRAFSRHLSLLVVLLGVGVTHALELEEKLTFRILSVSQSKKTILMNRGIEDGLVEGDHAKFFLTTGVIARALVVRVSPTRSVWSIYRIIDDSQIVPEKVMNLKISTALKLTDDPSRSLKVEHLEAGSESLKVALADGADDLPKDLNDEELTDLKDFTQTHAMPRPRGHVDLKKSLEVWGMLHLNQLSGDIDVGSSTTESSSEQTLDFSLGIEKYFSQSQGFIGDTSIGAFIHKRSSKIGDVNTSSSDWLDYGIMANYHFLAHPLAINQLIGMVSLTAGMGSVTTSYDDGTTTSDLTGSSTFFSIGGGLKYYVNNGFGMRAILDIYRTGATLDIPDSEGTMTLGGLRLQVGVSYRF